MRQAATVLIDTYTALLSQIPGTPLFRTGLARAFNMPTTLLLRRAIRAEGWIAHGTPIHVAYVGVERERYARRVANALGMIARHDPRRMARISRDVAGILVWPFVTPGTSAQLHAAERICTLDSTTLNDTPTAIIASTVVHEATHARLRNFPLSWENIARLEGICRSQERAFAERVPNGEVLVSYLENRDATLTASTFTRGAQWDRGVDWFERDGAPRSLVATLRMLVRFMKSRAPTT